MAIDVQTSSHGVLVALSGWDRLMNWRASVSVAVADLARAYVEERSTLEALIDHRAFGCGTHNGKKRPNRRRVGTMLGRGVAGKQFWAVPATDGTTQLLVLETKAGEFSRLVLAYEDCEATADAFEKALELRRAQ